MSRMQTVILQADLNANGGINENINLMFKVKKLIVKTYYSATAAEITAKETAVITCAELSTAPNQILSFIQSYASQSFVETTFVYTTPITVQQNYNFHFKTCEDPYQDSDLSGDIFMILEFYENM